MRYIISAQQAQNICNNYPGKTDAEKLANYMKECGKGSYNHEASRLHQKKKFSKEHPNGEYSAGYGKGDYKLVQDFHTEFILNSEGNFQNEINPEGTKPNGVINGASFNYANENDDMHKHLDINVVKKLDPKWRTNISNGYKSPVRNDQVKNLSDRKNSYSNKDGNYAINGLSSKDNTEHLANKFDQMVK